MEIEFSDFEHYARTVAAYYGLSGIAIRNATKADFPRLAEMQVGALCATGRDIYGAGKIKRYVERHLRQTLHLCSLPTFFVATKGNEVIGSGGWSRIPTAQGRELPCAVCFYVDPRFARRGVGRSLLAITETSARKSRVGILSAFAPLHGADLFRSSGYSASDILPLDLGDDYSMDLLVMRKRLTA
ncbi:MAG: GNAT family N-acetyltransferase [Rhizobiales bacterium]|nr:GNAT family N-acetyltransferase [Hyphomicrobiales bacterium]